MFIRKTRPGYYDANGQQHSGQGDYLILFGWNDYKALDEIKAQCVACQCARTAQKFNQRLVRYAYTYMPIPDVQKWAQSVFNSYSACELHRGTRTGQPVPKYPNGREKLWALVRKCALHQFGQFMMGTINVRGKRLTVSGEIGSDGLPDDIQDIPVESRKILVEVPEAIATAYWNSNGHNEVGQARNILGDWARATFPVKGGR